MYRVLYAIRYIRELPANLYLNVTYLPHFLYSIYRVLRFPRKLPLIGR